jgi:hypothetical protein
MWVSKDLGAQVAKPLGSCALVDQPWGRAPHEQPLYCVSNVAQLYIMFRARYLLKRTPFNAAPRSYRQARNSLAHLELPLQSKFRWSYLWYGTILSLGIATGLGARHFAAPLGLTEPGSQDDIRILQSLDADIDKLDIVRELRKQSYSVHTDVPLSNAAGVEVPKAWQEIELGKNGMEKGGLLDSMSGTRGLGVQRAFYNPETREMVAVVWIGGGLAGWPGVAHGGAIATIFEEAMARMVRGPNGNIGRWLDPKERAQKADTGNRGSAPSILTEGDLRQTYVQPGFLRLASLIRETEPPSDRACTRS